MTTITVTLDTADAAEVYAAVGMQLSKGDITPPAGETQFGAALAALCAASMAPSPAPPTPPPPTPAVAAAAAVRR